ncbi:MAG TPA: adenylate kinase [Desulfatiglandales bacterium]|nr:adenylate kinase [Desulfatiglandales bacterium]
MNMLFFGPNGSGKGTQGAIIKEQYAVPHIETGVIFRENMAKGTELGEEAKSYIDKGELVPDDVTIPMVLNRLKEKDCSSGWLLDGFPRNRNQAVKLYEALSQEGISVDVLIEMVLDRDVAKKRIMGRRLCVNDNNHPNNINIDAIKPDGDRCRVCGGELRKRDDDQDEVAIDQRHDIYYDTETGTRSAVEYFRDLTSKSGIPAIVELDGRNSVEAVTRELMEKLGKITFEVS